MITYCFVREVLHASSSKLGLDLLLAVAVRSLAARRARRHSAARSAAATTTLPWLVGVLVPLMAGRSPPTARSPLGMKVVRILPVRLTDRNCQTLKW
jgi:hypothetical protein